MDLRRIARFIHLAGSPYKRLPTGQKLGGLREMTWNRIVYIRAQLSGESSWDFIKNSLYERSGILISAKQQAGMACHPWPGVVCNNYLV